MRSYVHVHLCLSLMAAQLVFVVGVDKTSNQVGVLIVTISSNSNCVHALDCLLGGGCTSALLVLGGVHVDADGGCGLVRGAGQNLHSKFQEEISDFVHSVELWYVPTC